MNGLDWQKIEIPLAAGLNQRFDDRARQPPFLDIAKDVHFDEIGGVQTRYPFAALSADTLTDARRVYTYGDELLVFTKDELLVYHEDQDTYRTRAPYLAVKVDEEPRAITTGDQYDPDTARLSGLIVHTWTEGSSVYFMLTDETTNAVVLAPISVTGSRSRVVALSTAILLMWADGSGNLVYAAIDPSIDPGDLSGELAAASTALAAASFNTYYDVTRVIGADTAVFACRRDTMTSYTVGTIAADGTLTTATPARTCSGAIAVASHPSGTHVMVCRYNAAGLGDDRVEADYILLSGLSDVTVNQLLVTGDQPRDQITAAFRSVANSGQFRCYAFYSGFDTGAAEDGVEWNYVDTGGTIGTSATLAFNMAIASRAFDHDGSVFVNLVFQDSGNFTGAEFAQAQNSFFLYRDDALLVAKMATARAGGLGSEPMLPGVQLVSGTTQYAWAGTERRVVPVSADYSAYSDRGPRDITITFDSNEARRVAKLGKTLYLAGGEILQYDGVRLVEVGFHIYPYRFAASETAGGSIATNGSYSYKQTWRYDNGQGERERSTTATIGTFTLASQPGGFTFGAVTNLPATHKSSPAIAAEFWRTKVDPVLDVPFFLVTSTDPADTSNPNRYLSNTLAASTLSAFNDELSDAAIADLEQDFFASELEDVAPPPASIISATDTRLFLAGIAGDPHRVMYSKLRGADRVAAFNEALAFDVPIVGGDITALAHMDGTIVVFRETAIYAFRGLGFSNVGDADGSQNFQLVSTPSEDIGAVSQEAVAVTDDGVLFKSNKGWMLLSRGGQVAYVGDKISDYDTDTVVAIHVLDGRHQVRVLTTARMLVFDTVARQWAEWTISDGIHACIWRGTYCYLTSTNVKDEQTSYTGLTYGLDVETAWIKPADLNGGVRLRWMQLLGEYRSAHDVRFRIAYDFTSAYVDDVTWTVSPTTVGGPERARVGPSRQQCQAFKLRITAQAVGSATPPTGEALKLSGLGLELGFRRGLFRRLPESQKV